MKLLAMGRSALMDGFSLLGMETFPDATAKDVEAMLHKLLRNKERALIYLQHDLAQEEIALLEQVRKEGGGILISEIPDLLAVDEYHAPVEQLITRVLGNSALQNNQAGANRP